MLSKNQNIINVCLTEDVNVENTNNSSNLSDSLKNLKIKNSNRLVFGNLNINTINNKFEQLKHIIKNNVDVSVVTETKLDSSFPLGQFGRGVMIFVRDDIPSKEIKISFLPSDIECLFIEINIRKTKWLIVDCYHPPSQNDNYFFYDLSKVLDSLNSNYEKFLLVGDLNSEDHETEITNFLNNHEAKNIVKQKTCFKNVFNPSCVDLFITNSPKSFQHTLSFSCGLSDHHNFVLAVLKNIWKAKI